MLGVHNHQFYNLPSTCLRSQCHFSQSSCNSYVWYNNMLYLNCGTDDSMHWRVAQACCLDCYIKFI
ncbi:hypothetical protein Tsubulata_010563 [Turnera subulata]|uniref:Uncharacterized protein n=1 Tax=Turnera subulata TaxID=218843 RepID=A0A9Q0FPL1_9ROSI|nr:hypothetical protein Tsubulata_010563 [Turnera subulata]